MQFLLEVVIECRQLDELLIQLDVGDGQVSRTTNELVLGLFTQFVYLGHDSVQDFLQNVVTVLLPCNITKYPLTYELLEYFLGGGPHDGLVPAHVRRHVRIVRLVYGLRELIVRGRQV